MITHETPFEHTDGPVRQAPKVQRNIAINFDHKAETSQHLRLTRRGKVVVGLAGLGVAAGSVAGVLIIRDHNTIHIPSEQQTRRIYNVGTAIEVGTGESANKVKPTDVSTIARLASPDGDWRDLASELQKEVIKFNTADHYQGDPNTLQPGTPLTLPEDAHIGDLVEPSQQ